MPTEAEVIAGAKAIATSSVIDAPNLPEACWRGLSRRVLEAAEETQGRDRYDADDLWYALCAHLIGTSRPGVIEIDCERIRKACDALNAGERFF